MPVYNRSGIGVTMLITLDEYFRYPFSARVKPHTEEEDLSARVLLGRVNQVFVDLSWGILIDPDTGSGISGAKGGGGDGGFRTPNSTTGALGSAHRRAHAVDVYDPGDKLDAYITTFDKPDGSNEFLEKHGLYREHPSATPGWCHLQDVPPHSGHRTFYP